MLLIDRSEVKISYIRSPGPGGQNVNKLATAVQLRFNVLHSPSLSETVRHRLLNQLENKLTTKGDLIIKATRFRTQERNKEDAFERLFEILRKGSIIPKKRKKTKPTKASKEKRLKNKKMHGKIKSLRGKKKNLED